jgi:hypothetical protein
MAEMVKFLLNIWEVVVVVLMQLETLLVVQRQVTAALVNKAHHLHLHLVVLDPAAHHLQAITLVEVVEAQHLLIRLGLEVLEAVEPVQQQQAQQPLLV